MIDLDDGHVPNSTLNMFNIEAISIDDEHRLTKFELVNIQTLNISRTGLPGDGGLGWGLSIGLERAENSCIDCLVGQISGSAIKGYHLNDNWSIYGEFEGAWHSQFEGRTLRGTTQVGLVGHILPSWKTQLVVGNRSYFDGNNESDTVVKWLSRFGSNPRSNFQLELNYDGTTEVQFSYGRYW